MGAGLALLSSLMWGGSDFIGGFMSRRYAALPVYGWAQVFGLIVAAAITTAMGGWSADSAYWPWAIAAGVSGFVAMLLFYMALATGPMGIISPLVSVSVIIPLAYGLLMGETPTSVQVLGIVVAIGGILLASGPELNGAESARPLILAAVSAIGFGLFTIFLQRGSEISPVMTVTASRMTIVAIVLVIFAWTRSSGGIRGRDLAAIFGLGALEAVSNVLFAYAITMDMLATTAVLGSLYPVVTAILAAIVLRERLKAVQYVGVVTALIGVVLIASAG
ncbi:MAG: DMT family transporter [Actinomycetales bacterium]|nr:DMT family transporter [Actinomycetales bacterium]